MQHFQFVKWWICGFGFFYVTNRLGSYFISIIVLTYTVWENIFTNSRPYSNNSWQSPNLKQYLVPKFKDLSFFSFWCNIGKWKYRERKYIPEGKSAYLLYCYLHFCTRQKALPQIWHWKIINNVNIPSYLNNSSAR